MLLQYGENEIWKKLKFNWLEKWKWKREKDEQKQGEGGVERESEEED